MSIVISLLVLYGALFVLNVVGDAVGMPTLARIPIAFGLGVSCARLAAYLEEQEEGE